MQPKTTKLHKILQQRNLNQTDLEELIKSKNNDYSPKAYALCNIISGTHANYTIKVARAITRALDITYDELIDDAPETEAAPNTKAN